MRATDLGSANGTSISRSGVPMRVALDKHTAVALGARDSLDLCGVVRIELSGQHYVPDPSPLPIQYGEAAETIVDGKGPA
ncbi:hypothetical protein BJF84_10425 [Rhodococcus sp. CUA-806]|nr:hypothetical protein BJF84_10425 [Rhodococcus sp. CUA-806]